MNTKRTALGLRVVVAIAIALAIVAVPAAADEHERVIVKKKIHIDCEGEDCDHGEHHQRNEAYHRNRLPNPEYALEDGPAA